MGNLFAVILICAVAWLIFRRKEKTAPPLASKHKVERRFAPQHDVISPPVNGELQGSELTLYAEKIIKVRSNLNCVFDIEVNSYMRGYSLQDKKLMRNNMRIIRESCSLIRNSKNGSTIINRYDVVVENIKHLVSEFNLPEAKERLEIAQEYKHAIVSGAYMVDIKQCIEKINKLKTEKAKQKHREKTFEILDKLASFHYLPLEEIKILKRFIEGC